MEKNYKEIRLDEAVKSLDEFFGSENRTEENVYTIPTEVMPKVDVMTKLFEFFNGVIVVNGDKDILCEITNTDENNTVFELK
jgi:hypothetical protein